MINLNLNCNVISLMLPAKKFRNFSQSSEDLAGKEAGSALRSLLMILNRTLACAYHY